MKTSKVFPLLLFCGFLLSCNRTPIAEFTTDKNSYAPGETIEIRNTSKRGHSFTWFLPDGQTSTSFNIDYTIHKHTPPGEYTILLKAFSRRENKFDEAKKTITVQ